MGCETRVQTSWEFPPETECTAHLEPTPSAGAVDYQEPFKKIHASPKSLHGRPIKFRVMLTLLKLRPLTYRSV
jgi:hypothetical protein